MVDAEQPEPFPPETWSPKAAARADELASFVRSCSEFGANLRRDSGKVPLEDSPARSASGKPYAESTLFAFDLAAQRIVMVEDLLRALAALVSPPDTPFAMQALVRSILELGAGAWHLADPAADEKIVAGRAVNEQINNAERNASIATNVRDEESRPKAEAARAEALSMIEQLYSDAEAEGLSIIRDRNERRLGVEEAPLPATELVKQAWAGTHKGIGAFLYAFFSGVPHGRPTSFLQNLRMSEPGEGGRVTGRTVVTAKQLELWIAVAVRSWSGAIDRLVDFAGWDRDVWERWQRHIDQVLGSPRVGVATGPPT